MFQFSRKGVIFTPDKSEDNLLLALDAGAEDAEEVEDGLEIITSSSDLMKVREKLAEQGINVESAELKYLPTSTVPVEGETEEKLEKLLDAIDELDDVTAVHTNAA